MPDGISAVAAQPAAAPAAVSAPSAPSTPVSAPSSVETPAAQPSSLPASTQAPATSTETSVSAPASGTSKPEPQQSEFEGDIVSFLDAHSAWERERDGITEEQPSAAETNQAPAETPAAEAETKVEEQAQQQAAEPEQAVTPEALNALAAKSPELQAAFDANPEVKNALFAMARTNAKAAPILEVFPNVESAKFAAEAAGTVVNLRTGFLEAVDNPENFPTAFADFADQFAIKDKDGKSVLDAQGNPTFGEDFHMLNDHIVDTYHDVEIGDLESQLQKGQFRTEDEREQADMALQALKFIKEWRKGEPTENKPDLSGLSPEAKAYYEAKEREISQREEALGMKGKAQTAEQRKQERNNYEVSVATKVGGSVGKRLKGLIDEKDKIGAFIPSYVLEAIDPSSGIPVFSKTICDKFEEATYGRRDKATGKIIGGVAFIREQAAMLRNRPPSPEAEQARIDFAQRLIDEHLPQIFEKEFRSIQNKERADRERIQGRSEVREQLAEREPRAGGSAGTPKSITPQDAMKDAYAWVDQQYPDLDGAERTEKALIKKNAIMAGR
jgi:hypothetical protein